MTEGKLFFKIEWEMVHSATHWCQQSLTKFVKFQSRIWDNEQCCAIDSNNWNTTARNTWVKEYINEIQSKKTARVVDKHIWGEDEKENFVGELEGDGSELYL
jgi:hypothetical protein